MPITDAENKAHRRHNVKLRNLKRKHPLCLRCCKNRAKKREDGSPMSLCIECTTERAERIACERARKKAALIKAVKSAEKLRPKLPVKSSPKQLSLSLPVPPKKRLPLLSIGHNKTTAIALPHS